MFGKGIYFVFFETFQCNEKKKEERNDESWAFVNINALF